MACCYESCLSCLCLPSLGLGHEQSQPRRHQNHWISDDAMPSFPQCYGPHAHRDLAIKNATRVSVSFAQFICQTSEGHCMEMEETGHALFDSLRTSNVEMPCWKTPVATWSLGNVWMLWGFGNTEFCSQRVSWKGLKGVGVAHYVYLWMLWGPSSSQRRARNEEIAQMRDLADIIGRALNKVIHWKF